MQRWGVVLGEDGDAADGEFGGGAGDADGDLAAIGDEKRTDWRTDWHWRGLSAGFGICQYRLAARRTLRLGAPPGIAPEGDGQEEGGAPASAGGGGSCTTGEWPRRQGTSNGGQEGVRSDTP